MFSFLPTLSAYFGGARVESSEEKLEELEELEDATPMSPMPIALARNAVRHDTPRRREQHSEMKRSRCGLPQIKWQGRKEGKEMEQSMGEKFAHGDTFLFLFAREVESERTELREREREREGTRSLLGGAPCSLLVRGHAYAVLRLAKRLTMGRPRGHPSSKRNSSE